MTSYRFTVLTPMNFARDWTKYDYVSETRLDVMKKKLSKAIDYLRNKIEYNQRVIKRLHKVLEIQLGNFRKSYPADIDAERDRDRRSIFVYNIEKDAVPGELEWHFESCGKIRDVTMLYRHRGKEPEPLGMAYVEFEDEIYSNIALCMTKSLFMGQRIRIVPRNMNVELNVMQAIVRFWGQHLESQFRHVRSIKFRLRLIIAISNHLHELMQLYIDACNFTEKSGSKDIFELIRKCKASLRVIGKYRISTIECDEKLKKDMVAMQC